MPVSLISVQDFKFDQAYVELNFLSPEAHADIGNVEGVECDSSGQDQDPELFVRHLQPLLSNTRISASTLQITLLFSQIFTPSSITGTTRRHSLPDSPLGSLCEELKGTCIALGILAPWLPVWGASRRTKIAQEMSEIARKSVVERSQSEGLQVGQDTIDVLRDGTDTLGVVNVSLYAHINGTGVFNSPFSLLLGYVPNIRRHDQHRYEWYSPYLIL